MLASGLGAAAEKAELKIDDKVITREFLGFGVELDPFVLNENNRRRGVTDEDWKLITSRLAGMKLPIVRMMMQLGWFATGPDEFSYDSPQAKSALAHLDFCQANNVDVILTDWAWTRLARWAKGHDDPAFAKGIATYLKYFLEERKYTCIKYLVIGNEPDNEIKNIDLYSRMYHNVDAALKEAGIRGKVKLMGPDIGGKWEWFDSAAAKIADVVDAYDFHRYAKEEEALDEGAKTLLFNLGRFRPVVDKLDPKGKDKPLLMTEMGMGGGSTNTNRKIGTYDYAVHMGDYAIGVLNAGLKAGVAWCAFDVYYFDGNQFMSWGMWEFKDKDWKPKPWYEVWRVVVRDAARGSDVVTVTGGEGSLHAGALRLPASAGGGYRLFVANRASDATPVSVRMPKAGSWAVEGTTYAVAGPGTLPAQAATGETITLPALAPNSFASVLIRAR